MRTTVTLADDVAAAVDRLRRERGTGVSDVVNDLVRRGLAQSVDRPAFRQTTSSMGVSRVPLDDVAGAIEALDGPAAP